MGVEIDERGFVGIQCEPVSREPHMNAGKHPREITKNLPTRPPLYQNCGVIGKQGELSNSRRIKDIIDVYKEQERTEYRTLWDAQSYLFERRNHAFLHSILD